jgi:hypothetical protein
MTSNIEAHQGPASVSGRKLLVLQASAKSSTSHRRIQVVEGRCWVPIVAPMATLSSAPYGWDGILVERYNSVKVLEDRERTRTTIIVHLHLGAPAQQEWPLDGKRKRIPVVAGMHPVAAPRSVSFRPNSAVHRCPGALFSRRGAVPCFWK